MMNRLYTKLLAQDKAGFFKKEIHRRLNLIELLMLKQIGTAGEIRMGDLIQLLEVDRNLVTTTVKKLSAQKLIQKRQDESDGRSQLLSLLPEGEELCREIERFEKQQLDFILNDITINEEKTILKFISKIVQYHTEKYEIK